ncbi:MAG: hypothetical protein ABIB79_02705 [archaeon]
MKKSLVISSILTLFTISFVSAYNGFYGQFSISDLLDSIEPSFMILGAVFIISFALLYFSVSRFFASRDKYGETNKSIAGVISFSLALLITWAVNRSNYDLEYFLYDLGISGDFLYTIIPVIIIIGIVYLLYTKKLRLTSLSIILGGLFMVISFTDFVYEKGATFIIGIILIVIGFWLGSKKYQKPQS